MQRYAIQFWRPLWVVGLASLWLVLAGCGESPAAAPTATPTAPAAAEPAGVGAAEPPGVAPVEPPGVGSPPTAGGADDPWQVNPYPDAAGVLPTMLIVPPRPSMTRPTPPMLDLPPRPSIAPPSPTAIDLPPKPTVRPTSPPPPTRPPRPTSPPPPTRPLRPTATRPAAATEAVELVVRERVDGIAYSLERPARQTGRAERTYQARLVNQRGEQVALRAFICPAADEPFSVRDARLIEAPRRSGGIVVLQDDNCARVQGILQPGEQFRWELLGSVANTAQTWLTELVIYADYRTSEERNEWQSLALPILKHRDRLAD